MSNKTNAPTLTNLFKEKLDIDDLRSYTKRITQSWENNEDKNKQNRNMFLTENQKGKSWFFETN